MKSIYGKFEQIKLKARQLRSPGTPEERVLRITNDEMADLKAVKVNITDAIDEDDTISVAKPAPLSSQERGERGVSSPS